MSEVNPRVLVIPNYQGWECQALEKLCVHVGRGTAPRYVEQSDVRAIGQRCVSKTGFDPSFARPHSESAMGGTLQAVDGDVLLNSTGTGTIGRSVVFRESGRFIVDGHVTVLRPKEGKCSSVWLSAVLQSPWGQEHLERFCYAGSTNQVELSASALRVSEVPAPPYKEQSKIAEILDTLDAAIRGTEAVVAKLKAMKQGLLHDLLTRGIDANGDLRPPQPEAPHLYKKTPLGWLPKEWEASTVGEIIAEPTRNGLYKPSSRHGRGPLMVQMGCLFSDEAVDFSGATRVSVAPIELNQFGLKNGDLLFARRSLVFEGAGLCSIVRDIPEPSTFESSIIRLRLRSTLVLPDFAGLFFRGSSSSKQRRKLIRQVAVSGVSSADVKSLYVALPSIDEQCEIIQRYVAINEKIDKEAFLLDKLRLQKFGLMDDLLTGRTPVTALL